VQTQEEKSSGDQKDRSPPRRQRESRYAHLLKEDPTFSAWYQNLVRGSLNTGKSYLLRMGRICDDLHHIPPSKMASMNRTELMTFLTGMISEMEERGVSGVTIMSHVKAVKSWARFNGTKLDEKVNVPDSEPQYAEEVIPTPGQVQTFLDHCDPRVRVAGSLMAFSGLRPATIGSADGADGLKVGDLPELEVKSGKVAFAKVPTLIIVRKKVSKIRKPFITFAPAQACEYIRQYLEDRARGEKLTPDTAVVSVSEYNHKTDKAPYSHYKKYYGEHVTTGKLREVLRHAIRDAGFPWRPYVLRRYFDTRMMLGEADGLLIKDWRTFWMGHAGNIEFVYTLRKGLDEETIEKMRGAYLKAANRYLCTGAGAREEDMVTKIRKQLLLTVLAPEEVEKLHVDEKTDEEVIRLLRQRLMEVTFNQGMKQKVVPASEVEGWMAKGWAWRGNLGDGRAVLEPASGP
jgi:integrase